MMRAYYNENDRYAAQWLRNLVLAGDLPAGDVDERSIVDVGAGDLAGYTSCHFFAGIGGWPLAARLAGWPDERPLWTGSAPCQPFSEAGQKGGRDDRRHLWPHFYRLISACRPAVIMGEQVSSPLGRDWFDGVCSDLEGDRYACRAVDIPACAVDAPHERNRLYWIAVADSGHGGGRGLVAVGGSTGRDLLGAGDHPQAADRDVAEPSRDGADAWAYALRAGRHALAYGDGRSEGLLADASSTDAGGRRLHGPSESGSTHPQRASGESSGSHGGFDGTLGNAPGAGQQGFEDAGRVAGYPAGRPDAERADGGDGRPGVVGDPAFIGWDQGQSDATVLGWRATAAESASSDFRPNGSWWAEHVWITCHDGKSRRADPGISLLAPRLPQGMAFGSAEAPYHPSQERVAKWRGFGNAINAQLAKEVIAAFLDAEAL